MKANSPMRLKTGFFPALVLTATLAIAPLAVIMTSPLRVNALRIEPLEAGLTEQETLIAQANANIPIEEILAAHNKYRSELGLPALTWSEQVANSAQQWANNLAQTGTFEHSSGAYGENLWTGTSGFYSFTQMVDSWGNEKQYFRTGTFPEISTTGSWYDVGHYSQIIWRNTTEVGCGFASSRGYDILVCQYNPPGNYIGQQVY